MFKDKKVLVCGMAKSGISVAKVLTEMDAVTVVQDRNHKIEWGGYCPIGIIQYLGVEPDGMVQDFDFVIISPGITVYAPFVQKAQRLGIPVWGEAEFAYRLCPAPMIAITGTNGKTTVTSLVGEIMQRHNGKTVVGGNIGTPLTELVSTISHEHLVVAEISSFQLETIAAFKPAISAVLNITEDHLDRHHTMENYIAMKSRIFENQTKNDTTVLNYDNHITREMKPPGKTVFFSKEVLEEGAFVQDGFICFRHNSMLTKIVEVSKIKPMIENALAATALSLLAGAPPEIIAEVLTTFKGVPHRMEYVTTINGTEYYNDSKATNVDSAIKAIDNETGKVILIAGGYDKKTDFTPWVNHFPGKVDEVILIGETAGQIIDTCSRLGFTSCIKANSLEDAVSIAKSKAKPNWKVIFSPACASFDMFKNFEERGDLFKEYVLRGQNCDEDKRE